MKDEKITEIRVNGKTKGWYGKRIPKTAQEIIDEVEKEMNAKYNQLKEDDRNKRGSDAGNN